MEYQWRFKNLDSPEGTISVVSGVALEKKNNGESLTPFEEEALELMAETRLANHVYAYGFPLCTVYSAVATEFDFFYRKQRELIEKGPHEKLLYYAGKRLVMLQQAVLLDDSNLRKKLECLCSDIKALELKDPNALFEVYYLLSLNVSKEAIQSEENIVWAKSAWEEEEQPLYLILTGQKDEYLAYKNERIKFLYGSEKQRRRKKNIPPMKLVSVSTETAELAVALDFGIPWRSRDPVMPIWEFPIAQRPEIQSLLEVE